MNYEQMSDQQITDEIIKRRGLDTEWHRWDFCNSWVDMGPLIVDNLVGIHPISFSTEWTAVRSIYKSNNVTHENPLRAAAILYLMMTEEGEC
ncbi:hypothetical protein [Edwardsiella phage MSW-3]|uniref:NinX n=1 Tax=Edwardsiella phage MSW-3 TaxID=1264700 RepID=L0MZ26_9CAUD|nr:hypothetical protein G428_gp34 [Edwardsiella phage MSW-3]BAM68855.1 hypothetical protein [Edwardsiella phage MSW-3]